MSRDIFVFSKVFSFFPRKESADMITLYYAKTDQLPPRENLLRSVRLNVETEVIGQFPSGIKEIILNRNPFVVEIGAPFPHRLRLLFFLPVQVQSFLKSPVINIKNPHHYATNA